MVGTDNQAKNKAVHSEIMVTTRVGGAETDHQEGDGMLPREGDAGFPWYHCAQQAKWAQLFSDKQRP